MFWLAAGIISLSVVLVIFMGARRAPTAKQNTAEFDLHVYKDQLAEVERDLTRGVLTEAEADRVRTEVSRRILDADRAASRSQMSEPRTAGIWPISLALFLVIGIAGVTYWRIGAPGYPDLPLETRIALVETARESRPTQAQAEAEIPQRPAPDAEADREEMVAQLRTILERRPDDVQGWTLLARNEAALGNFRAAHNAQSRLITLIGDEATGQHFVDYAEMLILAAGGYISPEAEAALLRGLELDQRSGTARFYVGQMYAQQGRPDLALPIWTNLLAESQPEAPWVEPIQLQIADVARGAGAAIDPNMFQGVAGPSAEQIADAQDLSPEDQRAMIEGMVAGLADRLSTDGGPPQDWAQLITAYGVLGRTNAAQIVHDDAQRVFADVPEALQLIDDAFRAAMARAGASE